MWCGKLIKGIFLGLIGHENVFELIAATNLVSVILDKMARRAKKIRDKGKIRLSSYFKVIEDGERVAVVDERGVRMSFPQRLRGMSGVVKKARGKFKEVEIKDGNKLKTFVIHPVHLKVLK